MSINRKNEPVFMISVAARLCRMHPQTLRMYERLGLVRPKRRNGRNRLYSEADIDRLQQIQRLTQDMGVNLAGVEVILDLLEKMELVRSEAEERIAQLEAEFKHELLKYKAELERSQKDW